MKKITLLVADDHQLIRQSIGEMLGAQPRFRVLALCKNGHEAVHLAVELKPDIVLMDINMPGMDGCQATKEIRLHVPKTKVLCVSMHTDPMITQRMMQAGVCGYVTKNSSHLTLVKAILDVYEGHRFLCGEIEYPWSASGKQGLDSLSKRELTIASFVKDGLSSEAIGNELSISRKTVEVHRYNILRKLKLPNTAMLVNYINKHGFALQGPISL
jgi:DNA-binding NarL/FixJ family response regulator